MQSTRALATLMPALDVRGRVSIIPVVGSDRRGNLTGIMASCLAGIQTLWAVHTARSGSMAVNNGALTVPSYSDMRLRL